MAIGRIRFFTQLLLIGTLQASLRCGHPQTHLKSFKGILQADAFAGFNLLYATGEIREAACWAHARRKFFEIHKVQGSPIAAEALKRIAALYAIKAGIRGKQPDIRLQGREPARPILEEFHAWLLDPEAYP